MIKNRHFLKLYDFSAEELNYLLKLAIEYKKLKKENKEPQNLKGKNFVFIFEKESTRTRCSFEVAAYDQGVRVTTLNLMEQVIGNKKSTIDTAKMLSKLYNGIAYRGFNQETMEEFARNAHVPVWNALTNESHPTQILADILTIKEHLNKPLNKINIAYLGDARYNIANSLLIGCTKLGINLRIVAPSSMQPSKSIQKLAHSISKQTNSSILITSKVSEGVKDCDFLYTDIWDCMGELENSWESYIKLLLPYQVNASCLRLTGNKNCKFMHCLPSLHDTKTKMGEKIYKKFAMSAMEVSDDIFNSTNSIVFEQAENRLHTIKAVMLATIL